MEKFKLNNGFDIPTIGLGTWESLNDDAYQSCLYALQNGYTHIDTAYIYQNEREVGKAIKDSKVDRSKLFITSKLWNDVRGYQETIDAFNQTLDRLGLDYLDLYLIHWPNPLKYRNDWENANIETWKAFEYLYSLGKIKAIGVSNFMINHLESILKNCNVKPMVNQIRICPGDTKDELVKYCQNNDIMIEAYSPFARGEVFKKEKLLELSKKYNKTISQICLRWCYQLGYVSLPKSVTKTRIIENIQIFDFTISNEDMDVISKVETTYHEGSNKPDTIEF